MSEKNSFYYEWLPLPKVEFNILAMLAEKGGTFRGNYADMCRYLHLTVQHRNRIKLQTAVQFLASGNFITHKSEKQTQHLCVIPQKTEIRIFHEAVQSIMQHDYTSTDIAWTQVLKVYVWIWANQGFLVTRREIALELGVSTTVVSDAIKVLRKDYGTVAQTCICEKRADGEYRTKGQILLPCAWWNDIQPDI